MHKKLKDKRGTFSLEYAVLIVCIVGALVLMQWYIKGGIQGKMRQTADSIGEQYAPRNTSGLIIQTFNYNSNTLTNTTESAGRTTTVTTSNFTETQNRVGTENIGSL